MTSYCIGDTVRVNHDVFKMEHVRTPRYIQGKFGQIVKIHGKFANPEVLAYGINCSPSVNLYMVEFDLIDVWMDGRSIAYQDSICLDIFEHWLTLI